MTPPRDELLKLAKESGLVKCVEGAFRMNNSWEPYLERFAALLSANQAQPALGDVIAIAKDAINLMTELHSNATPDDTPDMNAVFPAARFKSFVDEHARLMHRMATLEKLPTEPAYIRLKNAVDDMCAVLGHHGEISARDDRVSAVMDALYGCDHKPVYAAHQAQAEPVARLMIGGQSGDELDENDIEPIMPAVERLQEHLVGKLRMLEGATLNLYPAPPTSDQTWNEAIAAALKICRTVACARFSGGAERHAWNFGTFDCIAAIRALARPSQAHFEEQPDGTITPVDPADMGISILDFRPSQAQEPAAGCTTCPHVVGDAYQRDCAYPDCTPSGAQPVSGAVMMSAHSLCPTDMPHPEHMRWIADYFLKHYQPVTQPVSGAVDAADIDSLALNAARQIMGIVNGSWLPGGAPWVQARIQEIVATFLEVPAFSRAQQAPAVSDGFNGDNAKLCDCIDALLDLDAKGVLVPHGVGGHARTMLSAAATRLRAALSQPAAAPVSEQTTQEKSC